MVMCHAAPAIGRASKVHSDSRLDSHMDPNFPPGLDIRPSEVHGMGGADGKFDAAAQKEAIGTYGIAGRVWEASYAMLSYLDREHDLLELDPPPPTPAHSPRTLLELGSGTGLVAFRVADHLSPERDLFVATDLPEVCALLEGNLHSRPAVRVRPLTWGSEQHAAALAADLRLGDASAARRLTHIICSDLVYFPALLAPLLRTLLYLSSPPFCIEGNFPDIIISYKIRSLAKEGPFWAAFGLWFAFAPVLVREQGQGNGQWSRFVPMAGDDETFVFVARRRPESSSWAVPESDQDLLNGVSAWGTGAGKADDTFETMLLMTLEPQTAGEDS